MKNLKLYIDQHNEIYENGSEPHSFTVWRKYTKIFKTEEQSNIAITFIQIKKDDE